MKSLIESTQQLGRAPMLPIAVLPVAGLLLRLGQPDLMNLAPVAAAGDAIFSNLGILFAIGVAVGLGGRSSITTFSISAAITPRTLRSTGGECWGSAPRNWSRKSRRGWCSGFRGMLRSDPLLLAIPLQARHSLASSPRLEKVAKPSMLGEPSRPGRFAARTQAPASLPGRKCS